MSFDPAKRDFTDETLKALPNLKILKDGGIHFRRDVYSKTFPKITDDGIKSLTALEELDTLPFPNITGDCLETLVNLRVLTLGSNMDGRYFSALKDLKYLSVCNAKIAD
jgi:hypothetical protein